MHLKLLSLLQAVHQQWQEPGCWRPKRFMPGGEYDAFPDAVRPYMVSLLALCAAVLGVMLASVWCPATA